MRQKSVLLAGGVVVLVVVGLAIYSATVRPSLKIVGDSNQVSAISQPVFKLAHVSKAEAKEAKLVKDGQVISVEPTLTQNSDGSLNISVPPVRNFKPGKYLLSVSFDRGRGVETITQDFTWGVLAFNVYQQPYKAGDDVSMGMAVLDDAGKTLCDAKVTLEVKQPNGEVVKPNVTISDICADKNVTDVPDYAASLKADQAGTYEVQLTAQTKDGERSLRDSFQVVSNPGTTIKRETSMRIYPKSEYKVALTVTSDQVGKQSIKELVPNVFSISGLGKKGVVTQLDAQVQEISWEVNLEAGKPVTVTYSYDAPDISPEFYLLGPASVGTFKESRAWQIASDEVGSASANRVWSSGAELNSLTADMEITSSSGTTPTVDGTTKRSGDYAFRTNTTSNTATIYKTWAASAQSAKYWFRAYVRVDTTPGVEMAFLKIGTSTNNKIGVRMNTDRTIELWNEEDSAQIGSASSALTASTWYRVEVFVDTTTLSSTDATLKLDGVTVASSTSENLAAGIDRLTWGNLTSTTANMYFDDIAINGDTTKADNWPGEGKIVHMHGNADGDNEAWTGSPNNTDDYDDVNEVTPSDGTGGGIYSQGSGSVTEINLESASSAGITSGDKVKLVSVGARMNACGGDLAGWSGGAGVACMGSDVDINYKTRIRASSGGTVEDSGNIGVLDSWSPWITNDDDTAQLSKLTLYDLPGATTYTPWTTADLDTTQIGVSNHDTTVGFKSTAIWLLVEYTPLSGGRLYSSGFELNSTTADMEWTTMTGSGTIVTSPANGGTYAFQSATAGAQTFISQTFATADSNGPFYARAYVYITTTNSNEVSVLELRDSASTRRAYLTLSATNTVKLYDEDGQVGSASSALSTATWYRLEIKFDTTASAGSHIVDARIDGSSFASASNRSISTGVSKLAVGNNVGNVGSMTTGQTVIDDVAINSGSGATQNTWPGAGKIIHLSPNAAGDNSAWTNGYANIDDTTPPNDATDLASETTTNDILDVNLADSTLGSETISLVSVGARFNTSSATEEDMMVRLKDSSNGTVIESKTLIPASTTWKTNDTVAPYSYPITAYTRPEQSTAWTDTQLDAAQIGFRDTAGSGTVQVSAAWLLVEYQPIVLITVSGTVYSDEGSSVYNCSSDNLTIKVAVAGGSTASTSCTAAGGTYSVTVASNPSAAGDPIAVWIDSTETPKATTVTRAADTTSNITGFNLYQNRLIVRHEDAGPITNANLSTADNTDAGIRYSVASSNLTVESGISLYVWGSKTFTPGGNVTTNVTGGDVKINTSGVFSPGSNSVTVGGSWTNSGTFTMGTSTVTFSSTAAGKTLSGTLNGATGKFYNLVFDGVSGGWTFSAALETSNDFTVTNGAVTSSSVNLTVGRDFTLANTSGVSYTPATSTLSVVRHFTDSGDKFVEGTTSVVTHTGTGTLTVPNNSKFETLNIGASGFVTTLSANSFVIEVSLTFNGGTVTGSGGYMDVRCTTTCTPVVFNSATTLNGTGSIYFNGRTASITVNIAGGNYGNWGIQPYAAIGNSITFQLAGNITSTGGLRFEATDGITGSTFTTTGSNYSITTDFIYIAPCTPTRTGSWALSLNDSNVVLANTTTSLYVGNNCGSHSINLGSSDVTVSGAVKLVDGTGAITLTPGTSDFRFAPPNSSTKTFTTNGQSLYNAYIQALGSAGTVLLAGAMDVNNNLTITTGVLDVDTTSSYAVTIGGSYSNSGTFEARTGTVTFDATTTGKTLAGTMTYSNGDFYDLSFNGSGGGWTFSNNVDIARHLTVTLGTLAGAVNVDVSGNITGAGTITFTGGTVTHRGGGGTRDIGTTSGSNNWTFNNLSVYASGGFPVTFNTQTGGSGTITVTGVLKAGVSGDTNITTFDAGNRTWILSGTTGDSFQLLASPAAVFTANTSTFQYTGNNGAGNSTIQSGTYYNLETNNGSETFVLEAATTASNNLTNTAGTLDVTASNYGLTIGNNYSNSGTFTARSGTVTLNATSTGKTLSGTLNGTSGFYNLTVNGSGGGWSNTSAMEVSNDLTMTAGTLSGTNDVRVKGAVAGTAGVINLTGGEFEQRATANKNFGTTSGSTAWTFYDLSFSNSDASGGHTFTTQTGGTGGLTVSHILRVGKSGDVQATTLNAGNRTWTLSGTGGDPFQLLASPAAAFAGASSTVTYTGNNGAGNTTVQSMTSSFYNLTINNAGETYVLEGATNVDNDLTITAGTLDVTASNYALSVAGNYSNSGTFTARSGTVTFTATATGKTLSGTLNGGSAFYNLTFNGSGGGWSNSSAMLVSNDLTVTLGTLSGTNDITVNGGDATGNGTINLTGGTFWLTGNGSFGGNTTWTFYNLNFGFSSGVLDVSTSAMGSGGITVTNKLDILSNSGGGSNQLNAGSKTWTLSGTLDCDFMACFGAVNIGTAFTPETSTFVYSGNYASGNSGLATAATYYNLIINNGSETFELGDVLTVDNDLTITAGTLDVTTSNYAVSVGGSYSNSGTYTARNGTVTFNATASGKTLAGTMTGGSAFYNLIFDGVSGAWTLSNNVAATNDFTVTNGAVTAGTSNLTVTRDFVLANTSGVSYSGGSSTITISRHYTDSGNKFVRGTSTVATNGTGTITTTGDFYNLSLAYSTFTTTFSGSGFNVRNILTVNGGTATGSSQVVYVGDTSSITPFVFGSATTLGGTFTLGFATRAGSLTFTMAGGNYGTWNILTYAVAGNSSTVNMGGNVTTSGTFANFAAAGSTGTAFSTQNFSLTASSYTVGSSVLTGAMALSFGSSTVALSNTFLVGSNGGSHTLNLGSSSTTITGGDLTFANGTGAITVTPGTSTVTMVPANATTKTYTPNGQSLYNFVVNGTGTGTVALAAAAIATNNFTISSGVFDVTASNYSLTVGGSYSNSGTFTARSGTVTFNATSSGKTLGGTLNGTSSFYNLTFNGVSGAWTFGAAVAVTNDFTVTNGGVTASNNNLTVTRDFTLANTSGVSYVPGSSTVTVTRDYSDSGSKLTPGTSTVSLNGTGNLTAGSLSSGVFYNLSIASSTFTTTNTSAAAFYMNGTLTLNGGTFALGSFGVNMRVSTTSAPLVFASPTTITGSAALSYFAAASSITITLAGGDYGTAAVLIYNNTQTSVTYQYGGNITTTNYFAVKTDAAATGVVVNTQNYSLTAATFNSGDSGNTGPFTMNFGSSTVTISGDFTVTNNSGGSKNLNFQTSAINVTGHVTLVNGTGAYVVNPGTSTLTMTPAAGITRNYTPNGQSLYNFVVNGGNSASTVSLAGDAIATNNFTITTGIFDASASNYNLTIGNNYSNSGTFTARSGTVTFNATATGKTLSGTLNGTSSFYNLTFNGAGGGWTPGSAVAVTNDFTVTNGAFTAGSIGLTVTRDFTIADAAGASYDAGSSTITVSRDWNKGSAGTFTRGTSTVLLNGTGQLTTSGGTSYTNFYNVTLAYNTKTTTIATTRIEVYNLITVGDASGGALTCSVTCTVYVRSTPGLSLGTGATLTGTDAGFDFRRSAAGTVSITGGNYGTWDIIAYATSTNAVTFNMGGAITTTGDVLMRAESTNPGSTFNTQNYSLTAQSYTNSSTTINGPTATNFGSSTVTVNNGTSMAFGVNSDSGTGHTYDLGTATITVTGNMRFANGTGSITLTPGTATVTHAPGAGLNNIYNPGSQSLYNYVINGGNSASSVTLSGNAVVTNNFTITQGIFDATASNYNLTVGGNFANSGTFTARSGTVTFNGSSQQTVSGTLTGTSAFYNLTITNNSGASATDNERTGFTASVIFSAAATSTGTYTITTANVRVQYLSGATYTYNNINWNGQSKLTRIFFRNSAGSGTWLLKVTGTQTAVSSVNVSRSDASVSGGSTIIANDTTDYDAGNNTNWNFGTTITVSGNIYIQDSESTTNSTPVSVSLSVNNGVPSTVLSQTSSYSLPNIYASAGAVVAVYIDGNALDANSFTVSGGSNISGINLYINRSAVYNSNAGSTTNTNICSQSTYPASGDNLFTCASVVPTYTGDGLLVGGTYAPGGNVNTPKVMFYTGGTYTGASETLTVTGSGSGSSRPFYVNGGTFTPTSNTVAYTSTSALDVEATTYYNLNLYPASGTQTYTPVAGTLTANNDFNVGTGSTLTVAANTNNPTVAVGNNFAVGASSTWTNGSGAMNIAGSYTNSGTFTAGTGTVTFTATSSGKTLSGTMTGGSSFYNVVFNGASGAWTLNAAIATTNNFDITNGTFDTNNAGNYAVTVAGNLTGNSGTWSLVQRASTFTISGNWDTSAIATDYSFISFGTSTVVMNGSGTKTLRTGATNTFTSRFYTLKLAQTGGATTQLSSSTGTGNIYFGAGITDFNGNSLQVNSTTVSVDPSATVGLSTGYISFGAGVTVPSYAYATGLVFHNNGTTIQLGGNVSTTTYVRIGWSSGQASRLDTNNYNLTIGTDLLMATNGTGTLNAGSSTISIGGNFTNTSVGVINAGTSTFKFTSTATGKTFTSSGDSFYNLTFDGVGGGWTAQDATVVTNDYTVTNGAVTANNFNLTVTRDFTLANTSGVSYTAGSSTITISRDFNDLGKKFTKGTSTVAMTGTGTMNVGATIDFHNLSVGYTGFTTTFDNNGKYFSGIITFNGGTVAGGSNFICSKTSTTSTPVVFAAATTLTGSPEFCLNPSGSTGLTITLPAGNYGSWRIELGAITWNNTTFQLGGNVTTSDWMYLSASAGTTGTVFNTQNYSLSVGYLMFARQAISRTGSVTANFGSSTVAFSDGNYGMKVDTNGGSHTANFGSASITSVGAVTFAAGTGTIAVSAGTSTLTMTPPNATTRIYTPNGQSLYNFTIAGTGTGKVQPASAVVATNDFTVTSGTYDTVSGSNYALTVGGSYSNSGTFTANSGTVTFNSTASGKTLSGTMTGGSSFYDVVFNGVSGAWTFGAAVAVTNDFTVTNGAVTASNNNLTVTRDFTLANTSGVSYTAGSSTVTVSRDFTDTGKKFTQGTSTIVLNGTGTLTGVGNYNVYNISMAYTGFTTTIGAGNIWSQGTQTVNGGTLALGSNSLSVERATTGTSFVFASPTTITSSGIGITFLNTGAGITQTIPGGDYGQASIVGHISRGGGTGNVLQLGGNLTTTGSITMHSYNSSGSTTGSFNTQNYNISASSISIGHSSFTDAITLNFGSSTVTLSSTSATSALSVVNTVGGQTHSLNLGSSTVNLVGGMAFINGSGTINVTPGTSTVNWLHTSGTKTYTPNGQSLYNLTMNGVGGTLTPAGAVSVTNDLNVTNGAVTTANYNFTVGRDLILTDNTGVSLSGGSSTITVGRDFTDTNSTGRFTYGTSTVIMSGTGTLATNSVYNISVAYPTFTTTLSSSLVTGLYGTMTVNGGTLTSSGGYTNIICTVSCTPFVFAAPTSITGSRTLSYRVSGGSSVTVSMAGGNYGSWQVNPYTSVNNTTYNFMGAITTTSDIVFSINTGTTGTVFNTNNFDVRASRILYADGTSGRAGVGTTNYGSSVVTLTGTSYAFYPVSANNASGHVVNLQTSRFIVTGTVAFTNGTGAITVNPGTSTMTFAPPSATTTSYYPNGQSLYNVVVDGAGTLQLEAAMDVDNDLNIRAGTLDTKSGSNYGITVGGNWSNTGTFTARSGTVTFDSASKTSTFTGATSFYSLTSTTPLKALRFTSGTTFTVTGVLTLTGSVGNPITVASTTSGSQWDIYHQGTESVSYTTITDSGCHVSSTGITLDSTNTNGGNNDSCWEFSFTISGTVYDTDGVTPVVTGPTVRVKVNGLGNYSATANGSGVYSISNVAISQDNSVVAFLDTNGGIRGETYTRVPGASSTINVYRNRSTFQCDAGPGCATSGLDVSYYDTDSDSDIYSNYGSIGDDIIIPSSSTFSVRGSFEFSGSTLTEMRVDGNMEILSTGNFINGDSTLYISGSYSNAGTYSRSAETVIFNATTTGKTISGTLTGATGKMYSVEFNGVGGGWTYSNTAEVEAMTISNGTLTAPSSTLTIADSLTRTSGSFTHNSGKVIFTSPDNSGGSINGNFTSSNAFYKVQVGTAGETIDSEWFFMNSVDFAAANATDTLVIKGGYVSIGEDGVGSDTSSSAGRVSIGVGAGETAALGISGRSQGDTNTLDLNANTSTPSCPNCTIEVGNAEGSGSASLAMFANAVLRLNPRSAASASDTGINVYNSGQMVVQGSNMGANTVTGTDTLAQRETKMCANNVFTSGGYNNMVARMTSGLATGRIYDVTGTSVNDTECSNNSHDSITRASTASVTEISPTVSGSGATRTLTLTTQNGIVAANNDQVGRYVHNLVDDTYFRIISSAQVGAGTDTLTIAAEPDTLSGMATNEDIEVTDGVRSGDTFDVLDYASITAEAGTACNATVDQAGEAYINAYEDAYVSLSMAEICNMGRNTSDKLGFQVSKLDGTTAPFSGLLVSNSRFRGNYTNLYMVDSLNNSGATGIHDSYFGTESTIDGSQFSASTTNELEGNFFDGSRFVVWGSALNTVTGNTFFNTEGLFADNSYGTTITSNVIACDTTSNNGITLNATPGSLVSSNSVMGCSVGIYPSTSASGSRFTSNLLYGNSSGIEDYAGSNVYTSNTIYGNSNGIVVNNFSGITLRSNSIYNNSEGVKISNAGSSVTLSGNSIYGNSNVGLDLDGGGCCDSPVTVTSIGDTFGSPSVNTSGDVYASSSSDDFPEKFEGYGTTLSSGTPFNHFAGEFNSAIIFHRDNNSTVNQIYGNYSIPDNIVSTTSVDESVLNISDVLPMWGDRTFPTYIEAGGATGDMGSVATGFSGAMGGASTNYTYQVVCDEDDCSTTPNSWKVYRNGTLLTANASTMVQYNDTQVDGGTAPNVTFTIPVSTSSSYGKGFNFSFTALKAATDTAVNKTMTVMTDSTTVTVGSGKTLNLKGIMETSGSVLVPTTSTTTYSLVVDGSLTGDYGKTEVSGSFTGQGTVEMDDNSLVTMRAGSTAAKLFGSTSGTNPWKLGQLSFTNASAGGVTYTLSSGGTGKFIPINFAVGDVADTQTTTVTNATNNRSIDTTSVAVGSHGVLTASATSPFLVSGGWAVTGTGVFNANGGTVTFTGTYPSTLTGATTFANLTISSPVAKTMNFPTGAGEIIHVTGAFTAQSLLGQRHLLQSVSGGNKWHFHPTGTYSIDNIRVQDGGCESGALTMTVYNSQDLGNNESCWVFNDTTGEANRANSGTIRGGSGTIRVK